MVFGHGETTFSLTLLFIAVGACAEVISSFLPARLKKGLNLFFFLSFLSLSEKVLLSFPQSEHRSENSSSAFLPEKKKKKKSKKLLTETLEAAVQGHYPRNRLKQVCRYALAQHSHSYLQERGSVSGRQMFLSHPPDKLK